MLPRMLGPTTLMAKVMMVYKVLIEKELQKEVAKEHRISKKVVCSLVKKMKGNSKYLEELSNKENEIQENRIEIAEHIL